MVVGTTHDIQGRVQAWPIMLIGRMESGWKAIVGVGMLAAGLAHGDEVICEPFATELADVRYSATANEGGRNKYTHVGVSVPRQIEGFLFFRMDLRVTQVDPEGSALELFLKVNMHANEMVSDDIEDWKEAILFSWQASDSPRLATGFSVRNYLENKVEAEATYTNGSCVANLHIPIFPKANVPTALD